MPAPNREKNARFWSITMVMQELNMCRSNVIKLAREAGALYRYGSTQRVDWDKLCGYYMTHNV